MLFLERLQDVWSDGVESESNVPSARESSPALARTLTRWSLDFEVGSNKPVEELGTKREKVILSQRSVSRRATFNKYTSLATSKT